MKVCQQCGAQSDGEFCSACGASLGEKSETDLQNPATSVPSGEAEQCVAVEKSDYTAGAFSNYFRGFLIGFVSALTFGIAYPFMLCWYYRWVDSKTFINGKQLRFVGKGGDLFVKYIIWWLLSAVTFGIYGMIFMPVRIEKWRTEHTHFEGEEGGVSEFTGGVGGYFGVNLLANFVTVITFSFGYYWAFCYRVRWLTNHKIIDGEQLDFNGKGMQFFGKCIVWSLLTAVTFGIYSFWLAVKTKKWATQHTNLKELANRVVTEEKPSNPLAVTGIVLSSISLAFSCIMTIVPMGGLKFIDLMFMMVIFALCVGGIVCSSIGYVKARKNNGVRRRTALAGIIVGCVAFVVFMIFFVL